jgi:hypothetical protein
MFHRSPLLLVIVNSRDGALYKALD